MTDTLYDRPDLYDLAAPDDAQMIAFYAKAAGGPGRAVLELACGSGRFTLPMAHTGARVTGGDLSELMLAAARQRADAVGLRIDFVHLDMTDFTLDQRFDSIVIASNSLLHLTDTDSIVNALTSARRHVVPHGQLVFDIFVPSAALLSLPPDQRSPLGAFTHPELGPVSLEETIQYDPISQISEVTWYWSRPGRPDFVVHPLRMRQIYPQELPLLLARAGWRIAERFGGFDRSPLGPNSMRQVVICEVAA